MRKFLSSTAGATFNQVLSPLVRGGYEAGINAPTGLPIIRCIDQTVCDATLLLVNKSLKMYNALVLWTLATNGTQELFKSPPFPAWKTGLDELWN